MPQVNYLT